jgi:hypothetical protein
MHNHRVRHVVLAGLLVLVIVLGVVSLTSRPAAPDSCTPTNEYGTQCQTLAADGLTLTGLEAQITTFPDVFDQHEWTFASTVYRCDPRGRTKAECAPEKTTYGSVHPRTPNGTTDVVCSSAGVARVRSACRGTLGVALPQTFPGARWVCTEFAIRVNGKWVDNGAGLPNGKRACTKVR